ncbi:MAG: polysaccharide biosynthesis tyrosine autokinase [Deltaproteobacteria bacterium]|nr:polysaccharide biosynthesis tyrosine autokinase [Deltaproteobacteria bacterium]
MSRVFDALKRARQENGQGGEKSPDGEWLLEAKASSEEISVPVFGEDGGINGATPPQNNGGSKSWRERLEELFFGWDLRRYKNYPLVVLEEGAPAAEQYKILREHVKRIRSEAGARFLSITSPVKRDGKTTVAVNLAAAIALNYEEEVLLIDADLRRPEAHRYFGLAPSPGLADYLRSQSNEDLSTYVRSTFIPGLQVLPAGRPEALSSELLARGKMRSLMAEIRSKFPSHQIIVDTPPVLSTPDPLVLSKHVEGILLVIRSGKTPREYLVRAVQSLNSTKIMGVVMNGVQLGIASKYYYRSH